ncbi:MAG: GNAT family N-acetyltransferase, partial [Caulobacterales bacterium]|nr:GNAT family N-acetyltransferase [Caulobacterales bacterium]
MIICENTRASEISKQDENIWRDFCSQNEYFKSPLLSPDFFYQIAKVRDDAFVAIYRENGKPIAFLAHHKRPNNFARPIGAPF